jgi:hypothetical protein
VPGLRQVCRAKYSVTKDQDLLVLESCTDARVCQPAEFIALWETREADLHRWARQGKIESLANYQNKWSLPIVYSKE